MNALATSQQTYFTTFAHTQRDLSANTIASYRDRGGYLSKGSMAKLYQTGNNADVAAIESSDV